MSALETIQQLLLTVMSDGLEAGFQLFTGLYRCKVSDNKDPEERGRIKVIMTDFGHTTETNIWITPIFAMAGKDRGAFYPPEVGDFVRVVFFAGDRSRPLAYFPGWYLEDALPSEFVHGSDHTPYVRGFISRGGHSVLMSDEPGKQFVQITWHKPADGDAALSDTSKTADRTPTSGQLSWLRFTDDGGFQLVLNTGEATISYIPKDAGGGQLMLSDSYSNTVVMDEEGVKLQDTNGSMIGMYGGDINLITEGKVSIAAKELDLGGAGVSLGSPALFSGVLGEILLAWLSAHTHLSAAPGNPTGPAAAAPTGPAPIAALSKSIKVKV